MKNYTFSKSPIISIIASIVLIGTFITYCIAGTGENLSNCPVPLVDHAIIGKTCPVVGRIGNVKLAIPNHYILGPVTYKGVDIWNAESYKNRPKHPTLDTEIDNFAIKIRLNNFKPVETNKDFKDYDKLGEAGGWKQPPENRWMYVGFETNDVTLTGFTKKNQLNNWLKDDAKRGPFIKGEPMWGLEHYISTQEVSLKNSKYEIFYDGKTDDAFIFCQNELILVPPHTPLVHCEIYFLFRELNLAAHITNIYEKQDISHWREIHDNLKKLIILLSISSK